MKVQIRLRYEKVYVWSPETEDEADEMSLWLGRPVEIGERIEVTVSES